MAVLKVRRYGDPVLRAKAKPVVEITPQIRAIVEDMIDTMYEEVGIGLAASQVGILLRLMVVGDEEGGPARALVNPVIAESGGQVTAEEGCLSIPGVFAQVTRAAWVTLDAKDLDGRPVSIRARGLQARVFQHEMDHLDGILFIDRLEPLARDRIKRKIRKEGLPADARHHASAL
jgi:peptide deformylase